MKALIAVASCNIKAILAALLIALFPLHLKAEEGASAQHVFQLSDNELASLNMKADHNCIVWLWKGRDAHEYDKRKKHPQFPEGHWYSLAQNSLRLTGNSKVSNTSLTYILGEKLLEMAFSGVDSEVTGRTMYSECMKYEPKYSNTHGGDPNPKFRSSVNE